MLTIVRRDFVLEEDCGKGFEVFIYGVSKYCGRAVGGGRYGKECKCLLEKISRNGMWEGVRRVVGGFQIL